jgi:uncharacterized protein YwqG
MKIYSPTNVLKLIKQNAIQFFCNNIKIDEKKKIVFAPIFLKENLKVFKEKFKNEKKFDEKILLKKYLLSDNVEFKKKFNDEQLDLIKNEGYEFKFLKKNTDCSCFLKDFQIQQIKQ